MIRTARQADGRVHVAIRTAVEERLGEIEDAHGREMTNEEFPNDEPAETSAEDRVAVLGQAAGEIEIADGLEDLHDLGKELAVEGLLKIGDV